MQKLFQFIATHKTVVLAVFFSVFLILLIGFGALADEVHEGDTLGFDTNVLQFINSYSNDFLNSFFASITQLGGVIGVIAITGGIMALLAVRHQYKRLAIVATTVAGSSLLNLMLKFIFDRSRPDLWERLVVETSSSFPSGHAMGSAALALAIMYITWNTKYRWLAIILGSLYVLIIGISRMYLGVHYPTDVLAGWIVSAAWLCVVILVFNTNHIRLKVQSMIAKR
jgi:membrane-associated phospholipid phosphatase